MKRELIYVGKKAPKGWKEISAIHLSKGIWLIRCEKQTK